MTVLGGALLGAAGLVLALATPPATVLTTSAVVTEGGAWVPPGDTVVKVTGDAANGFGIFYYDGSSIFPPTDSEAMAECSEYATFRERLRCRTEVRTWYRDLATMKRAINWAHYSERHPT